MDSADANAARLILAVLDEPAWKDDLPRMVVGSLGRQRGGAWLTTTANLWGSLALDKFSAQFESQTVAGATVARLAVAARRAGGRDAAGARSPTGRTQPAGGRAHAVAWPAGQRARSTVTQQGSGKPWLTRAEPGRDPAEGAARAPATASRAASRRSSRRTRRSWSRGDIVRVRLEVDAQSRHDLGRRQRPGAGRRHHPRRGLGRDSPIATRGEKRARQRLAGLRGAQLRGLPQLLRVPAARQARRRVHACASNNPGGSRCRRRASRRCTRRRASARRRTRAVEVAP